MTFHGPRTKAEFWEPRFYEWQRLWFALCNNYPAELAWAKFNQTDPDTKADLEAWRYLGGRR